MLFLAFIFFIWLFSRKKLLKEIRAGNQNFDFLHLNYLRHFPWLSILIVLLFLTPFFDAYAPNSYIFIEYTLLLLSCTYIFSRQSEGSSLYYWVGLVILFLVNASTYLLIEPTFMARLWMLGIHLAILLFIYRFYKNLSKSTPYFKWIRPAAIIGMVLIGLAVSANLFGRFSLSGILGFAGIFAVTHVLILPVFIDIVIEIILLQLLSSRLKKGIENPFNINVIIQKIKSPLIWISVLIWLIMLSSNLNIFHAVSNSISTTLTQVRTVGSISFKLISVLMFFIIIWISHVLQRLISYLFGETGSEAEDQTMFPGGIIRAC